jgi:hypothetical protein
MLKRFLGDVARRLFLFFSAYFVVVFIFLPYSFPNETNEDRVKMFTVGLKGALASGIIEFSFEMFLGSCYVYFRCQDRFDSWLATFGDEFNEWLSRADGQFNAWLDSFEFFGPR